MLKDKLRKLKERLPGAKTLAMAALMATGVSQKTEAQEVKGSDGHKIEVKSNNVSNLFVTDDAPFQQGLYESNFAEPIVNPERIELPNKRSGVKGLTIGGDEIVKGHGYVKVTHKDGGMQEEVKNAKTGITKVTILDAKGNGFCYSGGEGYSLTQEIFEKGKLVKSKDYAENGACVKGSSSTKYFSYQENVKAQRNQISR